MREMKDSGIKWIGNVPASWKLVPIRYLFRECTTKNRLGQEKTALKFTYGTIIPKTNFNANTDDYVANTIMSYTVVHPGVIMINCLNLNYDFVSQRIGLVKDYGAITSAYLAIEPNSQVLSAYATYQLKSWDAAKAFHNMGTGVRKTLDFSELGKKHFVLPTLGEQKNIVEFLDSQCSEIDAISADIQKEIEILEQYKRSVITEAVTKGLNPDVEMKDSSVEWVGIIPASWTSSRLGYETYIRARLGWKGLKADEYVDEGYAFISAFNIQNNKLVWTPLNYITKERYDESPEIKLHIGDVIIVKDGAGIGKCARIDSLPMGETAPNSSIGVITPLAKLNYRYLAYYLQSAIFNNLILKLLNGMGVPHLTQEVLNKTPILLPPKQEQVRIANFLDSKCCEIDSAIETKKKQIDILDAYKKSLIYEYVTGKKEVPAQN